MVDLQTARGRLHDRGRWRGQRNLACSPAFLALNDSKRSTYDSSDGNVTQFYAANSVSSSSFPNFFSLFIKATGSKVYAGMSSVDIMIVSTFGCYFADSSLAYHVNSKEAFFQRNCTAISGPTTAIPVLYHYTFGKPDGISTPLHFEPNLL